MADKTSAALFATLFKKLASDPTEQHRQWALELWESTKGYDFSPYQMGCDEALKVLGLAYDGYDHEYRSDDDPDPPRYSVVHYRPFAT